MRFANMYYKYFPTRTLNGLLVASVINMPDHLTNDSFFVPDPLALFPSFLCSSSHWTLATTSIIDRHEMYWRRVAQPTTESVWPLERFTDLIEFNAVRRRMMMMVALVVLYKLKYKQSSRESVCILSGGRGS